MEPLETNNSEELDEHIEAILSSSIFEAKPHLAKVFRFLWEKTRQGSVLTSKDLSEGIYGKQGYETAARVSVSSLRKQLSIFYETEGKKSDLRAEIPKGGYVIRFRKVEAKVIDKVRSRHRGYLILGAAAVIIIAVFTFVLTKIDRNPVAFEIREGMLAVLNGGGQILWKYGDFEYSPDPEEAARGFRSDLVDIDGDNLNEIIFAPYYPGVPGKSNRLYLFDHDGTPLWEGGKKIGREMRYGSEPEPDFYDINHVKVVQMREGAKTVLVTAGNHPGDAYVVAHLNFEGELLGEFWNMGHLSAEPLCIDLEGDGQREILLRGTNYEYNEAVLVVLGGPRFHGKSPQTPGSPFDAIECGECPARYYIRFGRSCLNADSPSRTYVEHFTEEEDYLLISVGEKEHCSIFYYFDKGFHLKKVRFGDMFVLKHKEMVGRGEVSLSPEECAAALRKGIKYWDGKSWVNRAVQNKGFVTGPLEQ